MPLFARQPSWFSTLLKGVCIGAITSALLVIAVALALV
jgi:hypothetical protein